MNNVVFVLSTSGWVSHGPVRASERQADDVARQLTKRLGWITAVGARAPAVPHPPPSELPSPELAALSPVWRDPELAARWNARKVARPATARPKSATEQPAPTPSKVCADGAAPVRTANTDLHSVSHALKQYYQIEHIAALEFSCKHLHECQAGAAEFVTAQESYVGPDYGVRVPRLVFLSLDSGKLDSDPAARTMAAVRARTLAESPQSLPKRRHWRQTHELALVLLMQFDPAMTLERVTRSFAHVNSAKCCQNKPGNMKADAVLFKNCREYVRGEMRILRPDVLVTQGAEARRAIESQFDVVHSSKTHCEHHVIAIDRDHQSIWIPTYHPRNYGRFWPQKSEYWPIYVQAVGRFLQKSLA